MTGELHPLTQRDEARGSSGVLNAPNTLSALRLVLSLAMVAVALLEREFAFLLLFLVAAATDWIDGKLARWTRQRTQFGAVLDSVAEAAMYAALLFGCVRPLSATLWGEWGWIAAALAVYALNVLAAAIKFRRLPSYHTYSAKVAWSLTTPAAVALLAQLAIWPLRVAMAALVLANVEALLITLRLEVWRVDMHSLWEVVHDDVAPHESLRDTDRF